MYQSAGNLEKRLRDDVARKVHSRRMRLHHSCGTIDIDDQSRQEVALSMHKTESVVVFAHQTDSLTQIVGALQTLNKEILTYHALRKVEHTHCDAANLKMTNSDKVACRCVDTDKIALLNIVVHLGNRSGEHPRMETLQRFLLAFFQYDFLVVHLVQAYLIKNL